MGFMDKIKAKAQEYDLQGKADQLSTAIEKGSQQVVEKAGELAHEHRDKISTGLDKAGAKFDEQTEGKYTDKVAKAKQMATKGVDKVAGQRAGTPGTPGAPGTTPAADTPYGGTAAGPQDAPPVTPPTGAPGVPDPGATPPPGPQDPSI